LLSQLALAKHLSLVEAVLPFQLVELLAALALILKQLLKGRADLW
jgi:hypothetical protein